MAEETDRIPLREYLLGELPPEERESVEERVFIDETLSEQVREVETELITDYLQGRLGTAEREH
ncbi:MAG TPA: hypothetical protein VEQ63_02090, partial [Bryobacteraceae bacterium]|nr:hypothetical protein [Bryobacteraceae bacterium]